MHSKQLLEPQIEVVEVEGDHQQLPLAPQVREVLVS
jgi:hypothetical protein